MEQSQEGFYRVIKRSKPNWICSDGTISSAMFKDSEGVSMDRQKDRTEQQCIQAIEKYFGSRTKGVAKLIRCSIDDATVYIYPAYTEMNPYHVELYGTAEKTPVSNLQALRLAQSCKLLYLKEQPAWT